MYNMFILFQIIIKQICGESHGVRYSSHEILDYYPGLYDLAKLFGLTYKVVMYHD